MLGGCEGGVVMTVMRLAGRPPITARGGEQADVDGSTMTPISAQQPIVVDPLVHALICLWRSETSGAPARCARGSLCCALFTPSHLCGTPSSRRKLQTDQRQLKRTGPPPQKMVQAGFLFRLYSAGRYCRVPVEGCQTSADELPTQPHTRGRPARLQTELERRPVPPLSPGAPWSP